MHEVKAKAEKICELRCTITDWTKSAVEKGMEAACSEELGDAIDMIKDLADAEKNIWKACYYKKVIEAMEEAKEKEEEMEKLLGKMSMAELSDGSGRMGYDNYRYASGRYAPKGHGHYVGRHGFVPMMMPTTYDDDDMLAQQMWGGDRMGYPGNSNAMRGDRAGRGSMGPSMRSGYVEGLGPEGQYDGDDFRGSKHGKAYDRFDMARRHYTESKSPEDKREMDASAKEHVMGTVETMKDIWKDADPTLRAEMKTHLSNLMSQMK